MLSLTTAKPPVASDKVRRLAWVFEMWARMSVTSTLSLSEVVPATGPASGVAAAVPGGPGEQVPNMPAALAVIADPCSGVDGSGMHATGNDCMAGEQLDIGTDGVGTRGAIATDDPAWSWAVALATLPEAPEYRVGATLRWAAREQGLALEIDDADTERRLDLEQVVGLGGLSPAEALDVLARATDLELRVENGLLIVAD